MQKLVFISHCPSENTIALREAVISGIEHPDINNVQLKSLMPAEATYKDILDADALILGTTENFGYMAGLIKDFFERIYYPCLKETQGLPFAMYIRAGSDGEGAKSSIEKIVTGLRWKFIQEPLICRGEFCPDVEN